MVAGEVRLEVVREKGDKYYGLIPVGLPIAKQEL
jgi:hypothetical protein